MYTIYRPLGYEIKKHPELKDIIMEEFSITENEYNRLIDGRIPLVYDDLIKIANILNLPTDMRFFRLMGESYIIMSKEKGFKKLEDYNMILNLIDSYIDLKEAVDKYDKSKNILK